MINDHLGHHAGDELLRTAAQQLLKHIRQEDCLARLGGDEFVMVLSCPGSVVRERLSTIRKALEAWNAAGGLPLELSFGLAGSDDGSVAPEVLLRQADARMMEEKNRVRAASHARIRAWLEARTAGRSLWTIPGSSSCRSARGRDVRPCLCGVRPLPCGGAVFSCAGSLSVLSLVA